jgi:hypothetical protein
MEQIVAPFEQRYTEAFRNAWQAWQRERETAPIDDAAWAQELERQQRYQEEMRQYERQNQ